MGYVTAGTVIAGRFVLVHQANHGGMGSIFRAEDVRDGRIIALKLMHPTADLQLAQRFVREAEILAELRHPGIVKHVAHGILENGQPFLAMEWLEGEDLAQRLSRQPLSLQETLLMLRRVAEALAVQQPFQAPHVVAALAKILFAEPPPLRTLRSSLPASLQSLHARTQDIPDSEQPRLLIHQVPENIRVVPSVRVC